MSSLLQIKNNGIRNMNGRLKKKVERYKYNANNFFFYLQMHNIKLNIVLTEN